MPQNPSVTGLSSLPPGFSMAEWDLLLPQAEITLNLLCNSQVNPKLSSYAYLFGNFDFNCTSLAPSGTLIEVHQKLKNRVWHPHAKKYWFMGPAMEHYTCFKTVSNKEITSDIVNIFTHDDCIPIIPDEEFLHQSLLDILAIWKKKTTTNIPSAEYGVIHLLMQL